MRIVLMLLLSLIVHAAASARTSAAGTPAPAAFEGLGIPADYTVRYMDEHGTVIPASAFQKRASSQPFNIIKDMHAHTATLKFMTPEESAAASESLAHPSVGSMVGKPFPSFKALTTRGQPLTSSQYKGKTTLINFFFALCGPCIKETPVLSRFHREHPDMAVLAVTYDDTATASAFADRYGFNWPVIAGQQALADRTQVTMYPTMVLVGPDGIVKKAISSGAIAKDGHPLTADVLARWTQTP
jgi:thiol-disulfide isomerase/thioredoxin